MLERVFRNPPSDKESISLVVEKQHTNKAAWCFSSDSVKTAADTPPRIFGCSRIGKDPPTFHAVDFKHLIRVPSSQ